jgi:hypothetical protein
MVAETLRQDLRIGVRVLVKEKSFCSLAVVVLALAIACVTTMFSVVNGVMLRGFSFPNADRLVSVRFVDPSSANFFGVNGDVSLDQAAAEFTTIATRICSSRARRCARRNLPSDRRSARRVFG